MSYILDALKRAETDRKAEKATPPARPRPVLIMASRPLWPWLVGGALALNAVVGAVFLLSRGPSSTASDPTGAESPPAAVERPEAVTHAPRAVERTETVARAAPTTAKPPLGTAPPSLRTTPVEPPTPRQRTTPALGASNEPSAAPTQSSAPTQATPPGQPARQEPLERPQPETKAAAAAAPATDPPGAASKLRIEVLVWAPNPKDRMVFLNGRKYVEGQTLANGAVIEQIAEDGIVLAHEGQRVRVKAETK